MKIALNIEKHSQALKIGGIVLDTALYFRRSYSENKEIKERSLGLSKIEKSIRECFQKQQKNVINSFSDTI